MKFITLLMKRQESISKNADIPKWMKDAVHDTRRESMATHISSRAITDGMNVGPVTKQKNAKIKYQLVEEKVIVTNWNEKMKKELFKLEKMNKITDCLASFPT